MDQKKLLFHLFVLLLLFSCLFSLGCSEPRKLKAGIAANQEVITKNIPQEEDHVPVNGRMDFEINDYPGSHANSNHDPKPPGKP